MKLKNVLFMGLSLVLVAALAIGGTVAYYQDTDSDVNVMTLGNVSIAQHEYERVVNADGTYPVDQTTYGYPSYLLQPFTQAKPLYPATEVDANGDPYNFGAGNWVSGTDVMFAQVGANGGGMNVFENENAVDKFVFVENTGKTDAYVRTLFAFETGSVSKAEWETLVSFSNHFSWDDFETIGIVEIDGNNYAIVECVYKGRPDKGYHTNGVLPAGEVTQCSLGQVYLKSVATNEDCEALDGNNNGTYDILVLSQAVQTAGFADPQTALDTAFGDVNAAKAAEWFGGVKIPEVVDKDNVKDALNEGKDVIFGDDIELPAEESNGYGKTGIKVYKGQTIDGADNTFKALQATTTWDSGITAYGGTIKNLTVGEGFRGIFISHDNNNKDKCGLVTLENVVLDGTTYTISCDQGTNSGLKAINCTFNGWTSYAATLGDVEFINCNFGEGNGYSFMRPYAPTTFVDCDFKAGFEIDARAAVTFENCTLNGVALTADNLATLVTSNIANASVK